MAEILAPSPQWQMRITKNSTNASPMTSKMWGSLLLKQNKKATTKTYAKFSMFALQSKNNAIRSLPSIFGLEDPALICVVNQGQSQSQLNTHLSGTMMDQVLDKHRQKIPSSNI